MTRRLRRTQTALVDPVTSSSGAAPAVKEVLNERTNELIAQDWCQDLLRIEKVSEDSVRRQCRAILERLQPVSDVIQLGELFETRRKGLQRYNAGAKRTTIVELGKLTVPVISGAAAATMVNLLGIIEWWIVLLAVLASAVVAALFFSPLVQRRLKADLINTPAEFSQTTTDLDRRLRTVIEKSIRLVTQPSFVTPSTDAVLIEQGHGLSSRVLKGQRVATKSRSLIEGHLLRTGGAAVGVTGERGMGKSEVLRFFSDDPASRATVEDGGTVGVFIAVPAAFKALEFLRFVLRRLVESVPGEDTLRELSKRRSWWIGRFLYAIGTILTAFGIIALWYQYPTSFILKLLGSGSTLRWQWTSTHLWVAFILAGLGLASLGTWKTWRTKLTSSVFGMAESLNLSNRDEALKNARLDIARDTRGLIARLRYAETVSSQSEGSMSLGKLGIKRMKQRSLSTLPLTEADLVDEFREFAAKLELVGYRVIVSIDEMDKLEEGPATEEFLNSVKQLFSIRSCSFLVSVSSSAWSRFVRRGIDVRDALDSSLDAIETIQPFEFLESRSLILHRREQMSDSQILFCHVMSGGLPREVLRYARVLGQINRELGGARPLAEVAMRVIDHEFVQLIQGSLQQVSVSKPPFEHAIALELNRLIRQWRNGSAEESIPTRPRGFAGLREKLPPQEEADRMLTRLKLYRRFFLTVSSMFCDPAISSNQDWATGALALVESLAVIRRELEVNPTNAQLNLERIEKKINDFCGGHQSW